MIIRLLLCSVALAAAGLTWIPASALAASERRVVVLDLRSDGVQDSLTLMVGDAVRAAVDEQDGWVATQRDEIRAALPGPQLAAIDNNDCASLACLTEAGLAADADLLIVGALLKHDDRITVSMVVVDVVDEKVLRQGRRTSPAKNAAVERSAVALALDLLEARGDTTPYDGAEDDLMAFAAAPPVAPAVSAKDGKESETQTSSKSTAAAPVASPAVEDADADDEANADDEPPPASSRKSAAAASPKKKASSRYARVQRDDDMDIVETTQPKPATFFTYAKWVALGLTVASAGAMTATAVMAIQRQDDYNAYFVKYSDFDNGAEADAKNLALGTNVLIGVTSACAAATVTFFLLDYFDIGRPKQNIHTAVIVTPTYDGARAGAHLLVRF